MVNATSQFRDGERGKYYRTSCPVEVSKFTRQFHISSDNTLPHPLSPNEMFFLINLVFISFVLSWILIAIVNCTNLVFLVLNKYILLVQHFNSLFSGQNNFLRVNCKMHLVVYFILFLLKTG